MYTLIDNTINYIKRVFSKDCSGHDYYHTMRVYRLAVQIAEQEKADMRIVQLAALLHDVDDKKLSPETYEKKDRAVAFMESQGVEKQVIESVCQIIGEVSFSENGSKIPSTIEGKCVQDADRLDALGAIGIARTFAYGGSSGRQIYNPDTNPLDLKNKEEYTKHTDSTSINHFYEKLLLLKDRMNTNTARTLAAHRQAVMEAYLAEFFAEWEGER